MEAASLFFLSGSPPPSEQENRPLKGSTAKKALFSPFSPMPMDTTQSDAITPKRRLSLAVDESTQSSFPVDTADNGYGESVSSCSSLESSINSGLTMEYAENNLRSTTRSPLGELDTNTPSGPVPVCKRRTLSARRLKKRLSSPLAEEYKMNSLQENTTMNISSTENKFPHLSTTRPSSFPSFTQSQQTGSGDNGLTKSFQGSGRSWIRQISSPLERMTLMSPTGQPIAPFSFEPHPHRSTSLTSTSESDGYFSEIDVFENDDANNEMQISDTISTLINAPLPHVNSPSPMVNSFVEKQNSLPCPTPIRPLTFQRSDSCSNILPSGQRIQSRASLKRSSPCGEFVHLQRTKRPPLPFLHCSNSQDSPAVGVSVPTPPSDQLKGRSLLRSQSYCMPVGGDGMATSLSPGEGETLIGDKSKPYALPLVKGRCTELRCVSPETLSKLLSGEYKDVVDTYTIIDCRYPYEFEGGHIQGAVNIWEKGDLLQKFFSNPQHPRHDQRTIYLFHCEFSSKRGPEMCRFLRGVDRKKNGMEYFPKLYYPELYLLDGGYKAFYHSFNEQGFCEPRNYCIMLDDKYKEDLRHCKKRAKSCDSSIVQSRRQVPSRCSRRRATVYFESRDNTHSSSSLSSPTSNRTSVGKQESTISSRKS